MKVLLVEPFFAGSHKKWAKELREFSSHELDLLHLPGKHWKWRMYGGAVALAGQFLESKCDPDCIIATDMLDLGNFLALTRKKSGDIPVGLYFHENQLTYPWKGKRSECQHRRDRHFMFMNYTSALNADYIAFNSQYHKEVFLGALPAFLRSFPDKKGLHNVDRIRNKSMVLHLGVDFTKFDRYTDDRRDGEPLIIWNHRWEHDKNPEAFFNCLIRLKNEGYSFQLAVLGQQYGNMPEIFLKAKESLGENIVQWGYAEDPKAYAQWLKRADILPVTSRQDFFGISTVEAIYCGCYPILPKRLAFPEHIPGRYHHEHLYETGQELYEKLKQAVIHIDKIRAVSRADFVKQYGWREMTGKYDSWIEKIKGNV